MAAELTQTADVQVKTTPSAIYNNLSCSGSTIAFGHQQDCIVVRPLGAHKLPIPEAFKAPMTCTAAVFVRNIELVVTCSSNSIQFWDIGRDVSLCRIPSEATIEPRSAAIVELGDQLLGAFGYSNGSVMVYSFAADFTPTPVVAQGTTAHQAAVSCIAGSNESSVRFASGCIGGRLQFWNDSLSPYVALPSVAPTECCTSVAICGSNFVAAAYGSGKIRLFAASGDIRVEIAAHARWINAMAFNRTRMLLATAGDDNIVAVWRIPTAEEPKAACLGVRRVKNLLYTGVCFNQDGTSVMAAAFDSDRIVTLAVPQ